MNSKHDDQYRSIDSSSKTVHRSTYLINKRQLPELQGMSHHRYLHQNHRQADLEFYLRSVKPRSCHQTSPISPLSPVDFSSVSPSPAAAAFRPIPPPLVPASAGSTPCFSFAPNGVVPDAADISTEKTMMTRLRELEKQLFDDDVVGEETDDVSVITNREWSETMQDLLSLTPPPPCHNPASPSPSSSTSSSASLPQPTPKQSLIDAASAVTEGNHEEALEILTRVGQVPDARGGSEHRVIAYVAAALRRRVCGDAPENDISGAEHSAAMQKLYELSPPFKLALWAANQAILEATADLPEKIHVVDFDGAHRPAASVQYMNLVQALAARQRGKPVVLKVTSVAAPGNGRCDIGGGERLRKLTDRVGVSLELDSVSVGTRDLSRDTLGCDSDEALVMNLAFKLNRMPDESVRTDNPRDELLRRVKGLGARVVVVVEQEMNSNTAPLVAHVAGVCEYYAAVFDSVLPREEDPWGRVRVEEGLVRKITNAVACEGKERVERCEMFGKWRARLRMAEFELRSPSQDVVESLEAKVNSDTRGNMGFTVKEEGGGICFGWMGRTLTVASAWR